jgi:adenylate cyclase
MTDPPHRITLSLRLTLLLVMAGLLCATVGTILVVGYRGSLEATDHLATSLGHEVSHVAAVKAQTMLEPAATVLHELQTEAQRGLLPVDDPALLGLRLVERLRFERRLTWLSYGDAMGRFTGAWRNAEDQIILNRSTVGDEGRGTLIEEVVLSDGTRELVRRSDAWDYDPRQRPFYRQAVEGGGGLVWTAPYEWWDTGELGITAALLLDRAGEVRGVFTADFRLRDLTAYLNSVVTSEGGATVLLSPDGLVIVGRPGTTPGVQAEQDPLLASALPAMPMSLTDLPLEVPVSFHFRHEGRAYFAVAHQMDVPGDMRWTTLMIQPASALFGQAGRTARITLIIGCAALLLAILAAVALSAIISRSLSGVARDLERVGRFELDHAPDSLASTIREIQVLGDVSARMKSSLRSFSQYVPADLVRQLLADGREARLGGTTRKLTLFYSDVEGFSRTAERLTTDQLVQLCSEYFALIDQSITAHQGTLDKFIGDGALAFFNAPRDLPDHPAAACHATLDILRELPTLRQRWTALGKPPTRTRIGLHTGEVLVGNIGTPQRMSYTVIGDAVNLCFGLQLLNKVYGTQAIASEAGRAAAADGFEWRKLDVVAIKGRQRYGGAYELLGRRGEVADHVLRARDLYEKALAHYLARRFDDAARGFLASLDVHRHDAAPAVMYARSEHYREMPPGDEWSGTYLFEVQPISSVAPEWLI